MEIFLNECAVQEEETVLTIRITLAGRMIYLLLGSKNHIHEVHVLEGTVSCRFYHLVSNKKNFIHSSVDKKTTVLTKLQLLGLTNILDFISCPAVREKNMREYVLKGKQCPLKNNNVIRDTPIEKIWADANVLKKNFADSQCLFPFCEHKDIFIIKKELISCSPSSHDL